VAKIYTRQGDSGQTSLFDGTRVAKNDLRIDLCGTFDELNSQIGVALASCRHAEICDLLTLVQHHLFDLGAEIATPKDSPAAKKIRLVSEDHVALLERHIDQATTLLAPLKEFILPGGSATAAQLHVARTVCRRTERVLITLIQHEPEAHSPLIMKYINRLGDLLFILARRANQLDGRPDVPWQHDLVT